MSACSIDETLALLDELDPELTVPLIAGHSACKLDGPQYNISDAHIAAIARRRGVVGLIACRHWMAKGLKGPKTFADTVDITCRHIDHLRQAVGSYDIVAIGSDQDGFIKPTLPGLESPEGYRQLEAALVTRYGAQVAGQICSGNALRVLEYWRGRP
jgi:microsomal dipeptidase-like Zn-dependent dipeptidase